MKCRIILLLLLLITTVTISATVDWVLRTEEWLRENPESLPNWLTPEEMLRLDEIGLRIDPTDPPPGPARAVGEFEPMSGVLIRYPLGIPLSLVSAMSQHVTVVTIVSSQYYQNQAVNSYTSNGVNLDNCEFMIAPTNSYWTRDYGPFYVFDGDNELGVVNYSYNRPRPNDDNIPVVFANYFDMPLYGMNIVHTGGNYMSNGYGTAASTTIVYTENTPLTPTQVDQYVEDYLGITDHIVVQDPTGEYIHHIDCWAKFLAPDKILIRSVPPSHSYYNQIENTAGYFAGLTSPYGTPFRIYRVYTPQNQPYTNSLILNDRVYVPTVNSMYDSEAITTYEQAMPGYEIIGVSSSDWMATDALHCRTKEIADRGMLYIRHYPLLEEQPYSSEYQIEAYIYPYSGEALITDSLKVYYRINSEGFQSVSLTGGGGNTFSTSLTEFSAGDTISYYIYAADQSGRVEKHPYIGAPDPHRFVVGSEGLPPVINHTPPAEVYLHELPFFVMAEVTDPAGIGLVELEYRINGGSSAFAQFDNTGNDLYECVLDPDPEIADLVEYKIRAVDMEQPPNESYSPAEGWHSFVLEIQQVTAPVFSPEPGFYEEEIFVTIDCDTDEAVIHFTLDGSLPDEESQIYTEPIQISMTTVIKAAASSDLYLPSEIVVAEYTIKESSTEEIPVSAVTKLHPAFPNPFNPAVNISFSLQEDNHISLEIFNIQGKKVLTLIDGYQERGEYSFIWDGRDDNKREVSAGVYFYRLRTDNYSETRKMILLK
jgi:agmatine/peptidylarginine deiminase